MDKLPQLIELKYPSVVDAVSELGSVSNIPGTVRGVQRTYIDANEAVNLSVIQGGRLMPFKSGSTRTTHIGYINRNEIDHRDSLGNDHPSDGV